MSRTPTPADTPRARRTARPARAMLAGLACGVCALGLPVSGLASHGGGGPRDFASGSGKNEFAVVVGEAHLSVAAQAGRDGGPPTGHVRAKGDPDGDSPAVEPFALEGEVTCIRVSPNGPDSTRAAIKYRFKHAEGSAEPLEGGGVQIFIEDNGPPSGGEPVDGTTFDEPQPAGAFDLAQPSQCDDPNSRAYDQIQSGDFTVHASGAG